MKNILLITALILTNWFISTAQNASIEGKITQADSITALGGTSVYLEKTKFGATTNGSGHYIIKNIPKGNYTLVISNIGYLSVKREIQVADNDIRVEDFTLLESIATLSEITVSGGNIGIKEIPGSVHYISPKEIEKFNYTDINRALRSIPGVNVQEEDGFGLFPSIGLRGTGVERNTKITVMEDGVLMAPAPYAAPAAYYFPTMSRMQGIEVIKGSSQIKYGPYTTGGAVNLISTQIPSELSGKIRLWGGSFGGKNLHTVLGNSYKNFAYVLETFQYGSNGFKQIDGTSNASKNSGFVKRDYLAKFRVNTNSDAKIYQSLSFKIGQSSADIDETYLGLSQEDFNANPIRRYAGSQVDNIQSLQNQYSLTHKIMLSEYVDITTTAYRTTFSRNWYKLDRVKDDTGAKIKIDKILDNPEGYADAYDMITGISSGLDEALMVKANNRSYYSQGIQTVFYFNFKTNKIEHNIDVGIRVHQDQIDRFQWVDEYTMNNAEMQLTQAGVRGTESNRVETANAVASYIQYKLKSGKFTATPGVRVENITQTRLDYGKSDPSRLGSDLSKRSNTVRVVIPGFGLDYSFNQQVSAFMGIHKGFTPPGSKEEVEAEESINYELGMRYDKNGVSGQAVIFFNNYSNLLGADLEAAGGGGSNEQFNGGAVLTKGMEFNIGYDLLYSKRKSALSLPLSFVYSYTDARFQNSFVSDFGGWGEVSQGDQFPYLASHQFTVILGLEHHKFSLNISGKYVDGMRTAPGQGKVTDIEKIEAYFVIDASANYNFNKNISFFANATNISNKVYVVAKRPAGLRPGLPRAFNMGFKANF